MNFSLNIFFKINPNNHFKNFTKSSMSCIRYDRRDEWYMWHARWGARNSVPLPWALLYDYGAMLKPHQTQGGEPEVWEAKPLERPNGVEQTEWVDGRYVNVQAIRIAMPTTQQLELVVRITSCGWNYGQCTFGHWSRSVQDRTWGRKWRSNKRAVYRRVWQKGVCVEIVGPTWIGEPRR